MLRTIPRVEGGRLYQSETGEDPIIVGTVAWYDWLERHNAFIFADRVGGFTAYKSDSDPTDLDWEASHTRDGKLRRVHLGPSHVLTLARLQAAAQTLASDHAFVEPTEVGQAASSVPMQQVHRPATVVGSPSFLKRTKFYRPRSSSDVIPRVRLLERLNAGLSGKATLVCAPAGFGKTTLLVEWLQTINRPVAWLSLDEHDNELLVFVHVLTAALQSVSPDVCQATASLLSAPQFPPSEHVATLLMHDLADVPDNIVLVLDDYHLIHASNVHTLLERLIDHLPPQVHLVLAARSDPPLPLVRWLARGHLNELRGDALRFTLEETEAFLVGLLGTSLAHETAVELEEWTEGWIAVLRLAALSLRSVADREAFLARLRHNPDRSVSSYLVEEILAQLAPFAQKVLVQTSILEQFCAELCVAVMGNDASNAQVQVILDWLERSNLFLVPLDERQGWYRFHHLFKQLLEQRLQTHSSQEEITILHRRASAWYAGQGLVDEAVEHALAAGDAAYAAQLVEAQFLWAFEQEHSVQMERLLRLVPEEQIQGSPLLLVARGWIVQVHGQLTDFPRLLTAAEQLLESNDSGADEPGNSQTRILRATIAMYWSQFQYFTGQVQASLQSARSSLEWIAPGEAYVASLALFFMSLSRQATGQEEVALAELQQALREQATGRNDTARLLFAQAVVYLAAGKLHQAENTARHQLRLAQRADLILSQNFAHWVLGVVHYEWDKLDAAVYHFSAVLANQHHANFWAVRDAMCGLALAYQARGLGKEAQETAFALLELTQEQHNMGELMTAYAFLGRLSLLQDEVEEASRWLELTGEQEVLRPLPFLEDPPITKARLLLARGDTASVAGGQALLTHLLQQVEAMHSTRKTIKVLALQAWAYDLQGRETEALEALEQALALGRPGGFVRTFADLPPLLKVLAELRKRRKAQQVPDNKLDAYLQAILVAMSPKPSLAVSTKELMRREGLEPLTERELQTLSLLERDLTNREIARELVVTPGTVKLHTHHVFRKLSVNNRRAAVTLARTLGLLAAT